MDTAVAGVARAADETVRFEPLHDARHRRRPHLLRGGELAECARPTEDEHRERGELRGRHTGRGVFAAHVPERMDRR